MLVSPLRYPGGKAKLYNFFAGLIQQNDLLGCTYCEPYAGGAGLALRLLSTGLVETISLNDIDEAIWAFWASALDHNEELCSMIERAEISIEEWHRQREIWKSKDISDPLSLGYATFYLNRTNRSGIIEGAGPVGGYKQAGKWKLDARFEPRKQADVVRSLAPFKKRINLSKLDAKEFLEISLIEKNSLTYLDPPYYIKGSKLYRNFYKHKDHVDICALVSSHADSNWIVSYDAVSPIYDIYSDHEPVFYSLSYSAGAAGRGKEVIYLSQTLKMPIMDGFSARAA